MPFAGATVMQNYMEFACIFFVAMGRNINQTLISPLITLSQIRLIENGRIVQSLSGALYRPVEVLQALARSIISGDALVGWHVMAKIHSSVEAHLLARLCQHLGVESKCIFDCILRCVGIFHS